MAGGMKVPVVWIGSCPIGQAEYATLPCPLQERVMGRKMPEYCEHGTLVDAGDFADPRDVQDCPLCHIESLPVKMAEQQATITAQQAEIDRLKARVLPEGYIAAPACEWHDQVQLEARLESLREAVRAILLNRSQLPVVAIVDLERALDSSATPGEAE